MTHTEALNRWHAKLNAHNQAVVSFEQLKTRPNATRIVQHSPGTYSFHEKRSTAFSGAEVNLLDTPIAKLKLVFSNGEYVALIATNSAFRSNQVPALRKLVKALLAGPEKFRISFQVDGAETQRADDQGHESDDPGTGQDAAHLTFSGVLHVQPEVTALRRRLAKQNPNRLTRVTNKQLVEVHVYPAAKIILVDPQASGTDKGAVELLTALNLKPDMYAFTRLGDTTWKQSRFKPQNPAASFGKHELEELFSSLKMTCKFL